MTKENKGAKIKNVDSEKKANKKDTKNNLKKLKKDVDKKSKLC